MAEVETSNMQNNLLSEENDSKICKVVENNTDSSETSNSVANVNNINTCTKAIPSSAIETDNMKNTEESTESLDNSVPSDGLENDEWLDIMGSGNFKKLVLKKGLGEKTRPERGDKVTVNIKYFFNDVMIEEHENFQFIVGDMDVIQGVDLVICLMEKEETSRVKIPQKLAYAEIGRLPDIPPDSNLECEIELLDVQTIDQDSLTVSERLQLGDEKRIRGNYYYERTEYLDAIYCYERAADYLEGIRDSSGSSVEQSQKVVDMIIKVYNNMAASHLKLSAYQAALKSVECVLNVQPKNVKALFRKAKILGSQGSTEEAISCLKFAASLEPETKVIQAELTRLQNKKKKEEQSQKAMYKRMFPQSEPKKSTSFSKMVIVSAVTAGLMAVVAGMAAYRTYHS